VTIVLNCYKQQPTDEVKFGLPW